MLFRSFLPSGESRAYHTEYFNEQRRCSEHVQTAMLFLYTNVFFVCLSSSLVRANRKRKKMKAHVTYYIESASCVYMFGGYRLTRGWHLCNGEHRLEHLFGRVYYNRKKKKKETAAMLRADVQSNERIFVLCTSGCLLWEHFMPFCLSFAALFSAGSTHFF